MAISDAFDLGRLVYQGIQATDAQFAQVAQDVARILQGFPDTRMTDIERRRAMKAIDGVLDRAFGATQAGAQRSDLTRIIVEAVNRAADLPFSRTVERVEAVLRNEPLYRGLYGRVVAEQRAARAALVDPTRRWVDSRGYRLSDRVWKQGRQVRRQIDQIIRDGIRQGASASDLARSLTEYLDPSQAPTRYTRTGKIVQRRSGGTRYGYAASRVRTLARTEITFAYGQATIASAQVTPGTLGIRWRLSASHTDIDICNDLADADRFGLGPGVYPVDAVPRYPSHPNDLCSLLPVMASRDEVLAQLISEYGG